MKKRLLSSLITGPLVVVCMFVVSGVAAGDTVYVDPNGSADFTTIQAAINDVGTVAGDVVIVRPGTYVENINMSGKAITLRSTDPTNPAVITSTIIDGGALDEVIKCNSGEEPNTVISGFVITNGEGGMYNYNNSSPTVTNCTFVGNEAEIGGGMRNSDSSPTVTNCTFSGNTAYNSGGGMINVNSSPTVSNCTFSGNTALGIEGPGSGGGMRNNSTSSPTVSNCTFSGNTAEDFGGGMYNWASSSTISNCTFSGNTAPNGGGMYNSSSSPTVSNCTFSGNTATLSGGGMYTNPANPGSPVVSDSFFCVNTPDQIFGAYTDNGGNNLQYCPPPKPIEPELEGDVDGDGDVDFYDLALMAANWLEGK